MGQLGFGISVTVGSGGGAVALDEIISVSPPPASRAAVTYTPISGAAAGGEVVLSGKKEARDMTVKCAYAAAQHAALLALVGVKGTWAIGYPVAGSDGGDDGLLTKVQVDEVSDSGIMTSTLSFKMDGV